MADQLQFSEDKTKFNETDVGLSKLFMKKNTTINND